MDPVRIAALLDPFLATPLSDLQVGQISIYIDILQQWNRKLNLTAVRDAEHIVTRHFGESLFAAQRLLLPGSDPGAPPPAMSPRLVDVGSGAGFPGLPIKIRFPELQVTLIDSNSKKATFLREVIRALRLTGIDVFNGRAEDFPAQSADVVTLRAVERFESVLPDAVRLLRVPGRLALLVGESQIVRAEEVLSSLRWDPPIPIPLSASRTLLVGQVAGLPQLA